MNIVKELRERAGMSQKELALEIGVSRPIVSEWEHQKKDPKKERLAKLAEIFKVDPSIVLGYQIGQVEIAQTSSNALCVPVLGSIPAGVPIEAIEDILDWEEVPADWARGGKEYFALKVHGLSMYPRYEDGDVVIFRRQDTCESGQDCAVMVNGNEATFKRVKLTDGGVMLQAINPDYESYMYSNAEWQEKNGQILGVVVELRRKV